MLFFFKTLLCFYVLHLLLIPACPFSLQCEEMSAGENYVCDYVTGPAMQWLRAEGKRQGFWHRLTQPADCSL